MEKAIICVDDEKSILTGLNQQIFRVFQNKYIVEFAESAEEAIEIAEEFNKLNISLKLLITDEMMPGMKGHELILKIEEKYPTVKHILLTGYANNEILKYLQNTNLISCFSKPWDQETLMKQLENVMELS